MAVGVGVGGDAQEERMNESRSRAVRKRRSVDKVLILETCEVLKTSQV
jgi:hypothetical protein